MRRLVVILAYFTALWGAAYSFIAWFPCFPVSAFWTLAPDSHCYGYGAQSAGPFIATYLSHTGINMALDVLVLVIPLSILLKESMDWMAKLRLLGLVALGSV